MGIAAITGARCNAESHPSRAFPAAPEPFQAYSPRGCSPWGQRLRPDGAPVLLDFAWTSLRKKAGVPHFRFHDLRHSFITTAAEADVPVSVIQSIVGHLSPEMTLRYTHIQSQAQRRAVQAVEDATRSAFSSVLAAGQSKQACCPTAAGHWHTPLLLVTYDHLNKTSAERRSDCVLGRP